MAYSSRSLVTVILVWIVAERVEQFTHTCRSGDQVARSGAHRRASREFHAEADCLVHVAECRQSKGGRRAPLTSHDAVVQWGGGTGMILQAVAQAQPPGWSAREAGNHGGACGGTAARSGTRREPISRQGGRLRSCGRRRSPRRVSSGWTAGRFRGRASAKVPSTCMTGGVGEERFAFVAADVAPLRWIRGRRGFLC